MSEFPSLRHNDGTGSFNNSQMPNDNLDLFGTKDAWIGSHFDNQDVTNNSLLQWDSFNLSLLGQGNLPSNSDIEEIPRQSNPQEAQSTVRFDQQQHKTTVPLPVSSAASPMIPVSELNYTGLVSDQDKNNHVYSHFDMQNFRREPDGSISASQVDMHFNLERIQCEQCQKWVASAKMLQQHKDNVSRVCTRCHSQTDLKQCCSPAAGIVGWEHKLFCLSHDICFSSKQQMFNHGIQEEHTSCFWPKCPRASGGSAEKIKKHIQAKHNPKG